MVSADEVVHEPVDCEDILTRDPQASSGQYTIYPPLGPPLQVYCEMQLLGGGWTVVQRRQSASDFAKSFSDYQDGFGPLNGNHWLGLQQLHRGLLELIKACFALPAHLPSSSVILTHLCLALAALLVRSKQVGDPP